MHILRIDALTGINDDDGDVGPLHGAQSPEERVLLDATGQPVPADAGRVDQ